MAAAFRASSHTRSLVAVVVFLSASLLLLPFFSSRPLSRLASTPPFATSSSGQSSAVQADSSQPLLDSSQQLIGSLVPQLVPVDVAVPQERLAARVEELLAAWDPTRGVSPSRETGGKGRRASGRRKKRSKTAEGGAAANAAEADAASPLDASAEGPGELAQPLPPGPPVPRAPHLVDCALSTRRHRKEWWAARPPDGSLPPWAAAWETRAHASKDPRAYEMLPRRGGGGGGIGEDGERDGEGGKEDEGEQGRELREERDGGGSGSNAVAAAAGAAGAAGPAGLGIADSNAHTDINALTDVSQSFPLTTDADVIMEGPQPPWVEGGERDNAPLTRHVQAHLWRHQFPANCSHPHVRFMYAALERRRRDGFAKQLAFMAAALGHAVQHGRVLVVRVYDRAQHTGCAGECNAQWHCYFLPETSDECRRRVKQLSELPASYAGPDPLIVTGRRVTDAPLEEWGDGEGEGEGDGEEGDGDMSDAENPTNQSLEAGKPGRAGSAADYFHAEVPTAWGKPWREMGEAVGVGGGGAAVGGDGEEKVGGASKGMPAPSQLNRVKHLWWRAQALRFLLRAPSPYLCHISNVVRHMTFGPMAARLAALGELAVTQADVAAGEGHQVRQGEKEGDEMRQEHKEEAAQQQQQEEAQREEEDYQRQEGLRRRLKGQRGSGRTAGFISLAATSSATNSPGSNDVPNKSSSATGNLATANKPTSTTASHSPPTINATASPATMEGDVWARHVPVWVPRPLVSVHVARPSRASTPAYVRTAMALLLLLRQQQPSARFVWLTADEQEPLEQVAATPGWTWLYSHTPRASNSSATTPASPPPSSTRAKQQQLPLQVAVDAAFANLLVAVQADAFIGSTLSPWSCLVNALRCTGGKLQSTFLDVGL
ncbi:hypothetical protein CLOM_g22389 [Closterium sp. NIES-68]|nr:hypothetical protein CLOM_g22389 [Closterium sp. NIES-68]GJP77831.1 hypothetical protein CLOP_g8168 [Closterium sp. NIES-67]